MSSSVRGINLPKGTLVVDAWYPWRRGTVKSVTKTRVTVLWSDGAAWRYDNAHAAKYLRSV